MLNFFIILSQFALISFLSCWLNLLYKENKSELSFPHKYPCPWQWRSLMTICIALVIGMSVVCLLPDSNLASRLLDIYGFSASSNPKAGSNFFFAIFSSFLLIMLWSDVEQQIIMNSQLALFAVLGLCFQLLLQPQELYIQLATAFASGVIFLLLAILTRGGIGGGDIKLMAALGIWLSPNAMESVAVGGIILGGLAALGAIIAKRKGRRDYIPYGPGFIVMALFAYLVQ